MNKSGNKESLGRDDTPAYEQLISYSHINRRGPVALNGSHYTIKCFVPTKELDRWVHSGHE